MRRAGRLVCLLFAIVVAGGAGCLTPRLDTVELTPRGPTAEELLNGRSLVVNGRLPSFDEKRHWEGEMEERVFRYLREHPELEQTTRYTDFRFWWRVTAGSAPEEVRVLLEEPQERTIDPARMAALAERHWAELEGKAKEAWVYDPAWIIYFGDRGVLVMVHRVASISPTE
jgi:hypothetical protein